MVICNQYSNCHGFLFPSREWVLKRQTILLFERLSVPVEEGMITRSRIADPYAWDGIY